ncbi:DUF5753 domain-containing protein [Actinomadura syzygii]|uniref:DUF5753 domain-containing protein n=1 Tax=Actinomadura syzygii TaxID=1427538 RepID=A0A5D0TQD4_9ACTN|nr:DUF5753 domain-containing protein [Actinomadura syzygii]TYC07465.1 hypothetical protein FXF65_42440 [Actinomadura syzygii]
MGFEAEALTFGDFQPLYIPGLLQTEDYARAVLQASPTPGTPEEIDREVAVRLERQGILTADHQPEFWFVISEAALRVRLGDDNLMRTELRHLAEVARQPNVTVQILPATATAHVNPVTGFRILSFADPKDPTIVYVEHLTGALFLERDDEVRRYRLVFDHLQAEALGKGASLDLIRHIADEMG